MRKIINYFAITSIRVVVAKAKPIFTNKSKKTNKIWRIQKKNRGKVRKQALQRKPLSGQRSRKKRVKNMAINSNNRSRINFKIPKRLNS